MISSNYKRLVCIVVMLVLIAVMIPSTAQAGPVAVVQSDEFPMFYLSPDGDTIIEITKERHYDSNCFVAHIITSDKGVLKSCFPNDNFADFESMTKVAREHDAIMMVNADCSMSEFFNNFIIRDRVVYRRVSPGRAYGAYFCVMDSGHLEFVNLKTKVDDALEMGVVHSFSFFSGPLVLDGEPHTYSNSIHPRTFIGEVIRDDDLLEYYIIVADGRSKESRGLKHKEEADILIEKGCTIGYNLDGGGSSEMVFDGKILNVPSDGHERHNHDFIYVKFGD